MGGRLLRLVASGSRRRWKRAESAGRAKSGQKKVVSFFGQLHQNPVLCCDHFWKLEVNFEKAVALSEPLWAFSARLWWSTVTNDKKAMLL